LGWKIGLFFGAFLKKVAFLVRYLGMVLGHADSLQNNMPGKRDFCHLFGKKAGGLFKIFVK
jgi:hypothetical protein